MFGEHCGSVLSPASRGPWNELPRDRDESAANPNFMDLFWISELPVEGTSVSVVIVVSIADFKAVGSLSDCSPALAPNATSPGAYSESSWVIKFLRPLLFFRSP